MADHFKLLVWHPWNHVQPTDDEPVDRKIKGTQLEWMDWADCLEKTDLLKGCVGLYVYMLTEGSSVDSETDRDVRYIWTISASFSLLIWCLFDPFHNNRLLWTQQRMRGARYWLKKNDTLGLHSPECRIYTARSADSSFMGDTWDSVDKRRWLSCAGHSNFPTLLHLLLSLHDAAYLGYTVALN